jgi:lipoate-protein ligase A
MTDAVDPVAVPPTASWTVERHVGDAASFHARELPEVVGRRVWWFEVDRPTVVLGSAQSLDTVDAGEADRRGVAVVRRRSGGGAVWLAPGEATWVDVILPVDDPRWVADVSRSSAWLGEVWVGALADLGFRGATAHAGPMVRTQDSGLVCFAGLAPGEVVVRGHKVVGISQRRNRHGARFQCAVLHRWDPAPLVEVLAVPDEERPALTARLAPVAAGIAEVSPALVVASLVARLRALG